MAEEKFKIGDIVILISGSPEMTVEGYNSNGKVNCSFWNEFNYKFEKNDFIEGTLIKVDELELDETGPTSADFV